MHLNPVTGTVRQFFPEICIQFIFIFINGIGCAAVHAAEFYAFSAYSQVQSAFAVFTLHVIVIFHDSKSPVLKLNV